MTTTTTTSSTTSTTTGTTSTRETAKDNNVSTPTPGLIEGVRLFMTAGGQLPSPGFEDAEVRKLRLALVDEEVTEYLTAEDNDDLKGIVDGLLDTVVVAAGSIFAYQGESDIQLKLSDYPVASQFDDYPMRLFQRGLVEHRADEYFDAEGESDHWKVMVRLYRLTHAAWDTLRAYVGTEAAIECAAEVTRSNLDKIVDGKVIKNPETGKILKPEGWVGPDIEGVLRRHGLLPAESVLTAEVVDLGVVLA